MSVKSLLLIFSCLTMLCIFASVEAQESAKLETSAPVVKQRAYIGGDWHYSRHMFDGTTKHSGQPWGLAAGFEYYCPSKLYFLAKGQYNSGAIKSPTVRNYTHNWYGEARAGYYFETQMEKLSFVPYVGLRYDSHRRAVSGQSYHVQMRTFSMPFGFLLDYAFAPDVSVGLDVQARLPLTNKQDNNDTGMGTAKAQTRINWRFELPITYHLSTEWDITAVPYVDRWEFESNANKSTITVEQRVTNWGMRLDFGYSF